MISNRKVFSAANIQQRPLCFWFVMAPCFSFTEKLWCNVRWTSPFFAEAFRPFSITAFLATWQSGSLQLSRSSSSFVIFSLIFLPLSSDMVNCFQFTLPAWFPQPVILPFSCIFLPFFHSPGTRAHDWQALKFSLTKPAGLQYSRFVFLHALICPYQSEGESL